MKCVSTTKNSNHPKQIGLNVFYSQLVRFARLTKSADNYAENLYLITRIMKNRNYNLHKFLCLASTVTQSKNLRIVDIDSGSLSMWSCVVCYLRVTHPLHVSMMTRWVNRSATKNIPKNGQKSGQDPRILFL